MLKGLIAAALVVVSVMSWPVGRAAVAAETVLADPKPDWDHPRQIILQLTSDDSLKVNMIFGNAINLQKFYGHLLISVHTYLYVLQYHLI